MSKPKPPKIDPKRPLASQAVMNVEKGEEVLGGWVTPHIPTTGIYKLIAKKKKDGTCEWAHFIQRDSGLKEGVMRGTTKDEAQLAEVVTVANNNLRRIFGEHIFLAPTGSDMYTLDGKPISKTKH